MARRLSSPQQPLMAVLLVLAMLLGCVAGECRGAWASLELRNAMMSGKAFQWSDRRAAASQAIANKLAATGSCSAVASGDTSEAVMVVPRALRTGSATCRDALAGWLAELSARSGVQSGRKAGAPGIAVGCGTAVVPASGCAFVVCRHGAPAPEDDLLVVPSMSRRQLKSTEWLEESSLPPEESLPAEESSLPPEESSSEEESSPEEEASTPLDEPSPAVVVPELDTGATPVVSNSPPSPSDEPEYELTPEEIAYQNDPNYRRKLMAGAQLGRRSLQSVGQNEWFEESSLPAEESSTEESSTPLDEPSPSVAVPEVDTGATPVVSNSPPSPSDEPEYELTPEEIAYQNDPNYRRKLMAGAQLGRRSLQSVSQNEWFEESSLPAEESSSEESSTPLDEPSPSVAVPEVDTGAAPVVSNSPPSPSDEPEYELTPEEIAYQNDPNYRRKLMSSAVRMPRRALGHMQ